MWHVWRTVEVHIGFWWWDQLERDISVDGRTKLKWIFKKWNGSAQTGLLWLRIGAGGGRYAGNFFLTADLLASQERLCSMEFVSVVGTIAHVQFASVCDSWRRLLTDTCGMLTVADMAARIILVFVPRYLKHSSSNCSEDNISGT